MKKKILLLIALFMLTACSGGSSPFSPATDTPTPTMTASPVPTATLTPTPTPVPSGPCDNPLVPLQVGNQWKYRITTGAGETNYTLKALEREDAANIVVIVELTNQQNNASVKENVICRAGVIENYPLFVMDMLFANYLDKFFNTYHDQGDYASAYQAFADHNWLLDWEANYLTEEDALIQDPNGFADLAVLPSSPIDLSFKTNGTREAITVPAGTFPQALKVAHDFSVTVTILSPTGMFGGILTMKTTQWYEPYVGLIRAQVDSASIKYNMQESSTPFKSVLELVEFTPGK